MKRLINLAAAMFIAALFLGCNSVGIIDDDKISSLDFFDNYTVIRVSDSPLFKSDGSINAEVLESLMEILNDPSLDPLLREPKTEWQTGLPFNGTPYIATTAADFSNFVLDGEDCINRSGAIIIKLFETIPNKYGIENGHLTEFTSQWWQLVYRSTYDGDDVLTLWMVQPYRLSYFNGTRFDSINLNDGERRHDERFAVFPEQEWRFIPQSYINTIRTDEQIVNNLPPSNDFFFEGNYSASIARENLLRDMGFLFEQFDISHFLVAPKYIPSGWQSSYFQTGSNANMRFYLTNEFLTSFEFYSGSLYFEYGLGASGQIWGNNVHFNLVNGKDGLSIGPYDGRFVYTSVSPTHYDLLWLPSDFEIRSMGHNKDIAVIKTFIAYPSNSESYLRWNYLTTRYEDWRHTHDQSSGRSGLWQLNGFDRGFNFGLPSEGWFDDKDFWINNLSWLRSLDSFAMGNANVVSYTGNRYGYGVNQMAGLRSAVHLSLSLILPSGWA